MIFRKVWSWSGPADQDLVSVLHGVEVQTLHVSVQEELWTWNLQTHQLSISMWAESQHLHHGNLGSPWQQQPSLTLELT